MDRVNGGMKRSSSENATNATRDPETIFSNVSSTTGPDPVISKPWKQRFSFRQPRKQATLEEVRLDLHFFHLFKVCVAHGNYIGLATLFQIDQATFICRQ